MKHYQRTEVPASEIVTLRMVTCDFCRREITRKPYRKDEVIIACENATNYPEGGNGFRTSFDCCPECWRTKVLPALQAMGATPLTSEVHW